MPNINHDRPQRFATVIQKYVSQIMLTSTIAHDVPECRKLSITLVEVSPDCRHAWITLSCLYDDVDLCSTVKKLNKFSKKIAHLLGKQSSFRYLPHITFLSIYDAP